MRISSYAADLYFMLVEECNIGRWENPFYVETRHIEHILGVSRPTICKARKELEALGLIQYEEGKNGNAASKYTLSSVNVVNTECKRDLHWKPTKKSGSVNVVNSSVNEVNTECKRDLHWKPTKKSGSVNVVNSSVNEVNTDTLLYNIDIKTTSTDVEVPTADADGVVKKSRKKVVKKKEVEPEIPKPEKPKKKSTPKKKDPPKIVTRAREIFEAYYEQEYESAYYWEAKDAVALKKLLQKISYSREHRPVPLPIDDDSVLDALTKFLSSIEKAWLRDNFSVTNISSQYNNIVSEIRNRSKSLTPNVRYNKTAQAGRASVGADLSDSDRQRNAILADIAEADRRFLARRQSVSDVPYTELPAVADE